MATPTLVYNWAAMPLICENVASYVKNVQNPGGNGDLNGLPVFHFDPSNDDKAKRRKLSCGCFKHDTCPQQSSPGKQSGLITNIAGPWAAANGFRAISQQDTQIIYAGPNPSLNKTTNSLNPKVPQNAIPGRFFRGGMAFTCDESPAATFIQGGLGAETICAMSNWKTFRGQSSPTGGNPGKYFFSAGKDAEQDWQARAHNLLRNSFGIKSSVGQDTVYPFSFTTATMGSVATKAYVIRDAQTTKTVKKRNLAPTVVTYTTRETAAVDEEFLLRTRHLNELDDDEEFRPAAPAPRRHLARAVSGPTSTQTSTNSLSTARFSSSNTTMSSTSRSSFISGSPVSSATSGALSTSGSISSSSSSQGLLSSPTSSSGGIPASITPGPSGTVSAGGPGVTSKASSVSSTVAVASSAAAALASNPSSQQAKKAQDDTHAARDAAAALLVASIAGTPLATALATLVASLTEAAAIADTAAAATSTSAITAAAADLVAKLAEAAKDADEVNDDSENPESGSASNSNTASNSVSSSGSSSSTPSSASSSTGSSTSSAASAGPSVCEFDYEIDGSEDVEVGDPDYDDDSSDFTGCLPILGAAGATIGCGVSASISGTSSMTRASSTSGVSSMLGTSSTPATISVSATTTTTPMSSSSIPPSSTIRSSTPPTTTSSVPSSAPTDSNPPDNVPCQDDCLAIIPQLSIYGDKVCSSDDLSKFLDHGTSTDPNGNADWFRISSHGNCFLTMAKSAAHRGFPDQYCFIKSGLIDFVNKNALGCNFGDGFNRTSGPTGQVSKFSGMGEVCLSNFQNYQSCGEYDL